jgi:hypothetical protein
MIDAAKLDEAKDLKKTADAAYAVFKKTPTTTNASTWTLSTRAFNDFCVKLISDLIQEEATDKTEQILANIDEYKTCKHCNEELLFLTSNNSFIASSSFLEDFKGWCHDCLVEHCVSTECKDCRVVYDRINCSFKKIKEIYLENSQESLD